MKNPKIIKVIINKYFLKKIFHIKINHKIRKISWIKKYPKIIK